MNQRIQELADEAAKFSAIMALPTGESGDNLFVEKFAELIIRECAELVKDFYQEDEFTCYSAKTEIKEHFGVEL